MAQEVPQFVIEVLKQAHRISGKCKEDGRQQEMEGLTYPYDADKVREGEAKASRHNHRQGMVESIAQDLGLPDSIFGKEA